MALIPPGTIIQYTDANGSIWSGFVTTNNGVFSRATYYEATGNDRETANWFNTGPLITEDDTGATPNSFKIVFQFSQSTLEYYGAVGNGTTNDKAAIISALNSGMIIDGQGKTYGVAGIISSSQIPNFKGLQNCTLKQLTPELAGCRTLYIDGLSNFNIDNIKIDLGGNFADGNSSDNAGMYISNCENIILNKCEVYNGGFVTGITVTRSTRCYITNNYVHDLHYDRPANDPTGDVIQGINLFDCLQTYVSGNHVYNLWGYLLGTPSPLHTRGWAINGDCETLSFIGNSASRCNQCFDFSGGEGTSLSCVIGNTATDGGTWGFKFANTQRRMVIGGNVAVRAGQAGFVISGLSAAADAEHLPKDYILNGCLAFDTGAPNPITGTSIWAGAVGFKILLNTTIDSTNPINIQLSNCQAIDRQAVPTMLYGYQNQIDYSGIGMNTLTNCTSVGHTTAEQIGFHYVFCSLSGTGNFATVNNTPIGITWDVEVADTINMHAASSSNVVAPFDRFYQIDGVITFAANATGNRIIDVLLNGGARATSNVPAAAAGVTKVSFTAVIKMLATHTIRIQATQTSGGALNIDLTTSTFTVRAI